MLSASAQPASSIARPLPAHCSLLVQVRVKAGPSGSPPELTRSDPSRVGSSRVSAARWIGSTSGPFRVTLHSSAIYVKRRVLVRWRGYDHRGLPPPKHKPRFAADSCCWLSAVDSLVTGAIVELDRNVRSQEGPARASECDSYSHNGAATETENPAPNAPVVSTNNTKAQRPPPSSSLLSTSSTSVSGQVRHGGARTMTGNLKVQVNQRIVEIDVTTVRVTTLGDVPV